MTSTHLAARNMNPRPKSPRNKERMCGKRMRPEGENHSRNLAPRTPSSALTAPMRSSVIASFMSARTNSMMDAPGSASVPSLLRQPNCSMRMDVQTARMVVRVRFSTSSPWASTRSTRVPWRRSERTCCLPCSSWTHCTTASALGRSLGLSASIRRISEQTSGCSCCTGQSAGRQRSCMLRSTTARSMPVPKGGWHISKSMIPRE
mmetsp:Transcript_11008/g.31565  ORF Transcript_11008/g.31565 Transcript_11008/m.31565 type:complete len:205 (+) Transcript_11008:53-667(+)